VILLDILTYARVFQTDGRRRDRWTKLLYRKMALGVQSNKFCESTPLSIEAKEKRGPEIPILFTPAISTR